MNFYLPTKDIYSLAVKGSLPTTQFDVLRQILDKSLLTTEDGISLRKLIIDTGYIDVILNCLSIVTHNSDLCDELAEKKTDFKRPEFTTYNAEQVMLKQKYEETHIMTILEILSSFIHPKESNNKDPANFEFPQAFAETLKKSCLFQVLRSYLENDSMMDIMEKLPIYRKIVKLINAIGTSSLSDLLTVKHEDDSKSFADLFVKLMMLIVDYEQIYGEKLDGEAAQFISEMFYTNVMIRSKFEPLEEEEHEKESVPECPMSLEDKYLKVMKALQFDTYEMIGETSNGLKFTVPYGFEFVLHFIGIASYSGHYKRLAQESATLSTCLPLSYNSSIFIRQDADRLDVMKCLITGPSNTPYANGCFEFDAYFPPNYPMVPVCMLYKTVTGSPHNINPNLYNNGMICLSILNTWDGSADSKWNPKKSTLMEVLIAIQTTVFVSEPYFNEPAFEKIRDTPKGDLESRLYTCCTYVASIQYAIIQQIRNPSACFKDIIYTHFWFKRNEICQQVRNWIHEVKAYSQKGECAEKFLPIYQQLKCRYVELRNMLAELPVPENLEDFENKFDYITN